MRALFSILLMLLGGALNAAEGTRLIAAPTSAVTLDGRSNLAAWRCQGASIDATMTVAASAERINQIIDRIEDGNIGVWMAKPEAGRFPPPAFQLRVPVSAFRCGNRIMESDLRRALNAQDHPAVEFVFRELRGGIEHDLDSSLYRARIGGDLTLAGVTRFIELTVSARRVSPSQFELEAQLPLKMTDFGVKPPTALFGAVRAADLLTVRFNLALQVK